ncbi:hypothetical protein LAZ67_18000844 [Cordylochernes scorpioides]|uniref:Tc1-like transposase DDE domain-containing protein n=1 Tax=Cordylochernes scorpioides TaxID=51811 RepID=A0ABY6LF56_9ARAC|nr:hypothetical protein LAZ67_18000844 [Cordylochernes scorpioides]
MKKNASVFLKKNQTTASRPFSCLCLGDTQSLHPLLTSTQQPYCRIMSSQKCKLESITIEKKEICQLARMSKNEIGERFSLPRTTVRDILTQAEKWENYTGSLQKPRFYGLGWNLLGRSHSTPFFRQGTLTGQRYRDEILAAYVMPQALEMGENVLLMYDNARTHRVGVVNTFLQNHAIARMNWPARSPDLNPIEHVWDNLRRRISSLQPPPRNTHELETALTQEWALISQELINSLILTGFTRPAATIPEMVPATLDDATVGIDDNYISPLKLRRGIRSTIDELPVRRCYQRQNSGQLGVNLDDYFVSEILVYTPLPAVTIEQASSTLRLNYRVMPALTLLNLPLVVSCSCLASRSVRAPSQWFGIHVSDLEALLRRPSPGLQGMRMTTQLPLVHFPSSDVSNAGCELRTLQEKEAIKGSMSVSADQTIQDRAAPGAIDWEPWRAPVIQLLGGLERKVAGSEKVKIGSSVRTSNYYIEYYSVFSAAKYIETSQNSVEKGSASLADKDVGSVVVATMIRVVSGVELRLHKRTRHIRCHHGDGERVSPADTSLGENCLETSAIVVATMIRVVSGVELRLHKRTRHIRCHHGDGERVSPEDPALTSVLEMLEYDGSLQHRFKWTTQYPRLTMDILPNENNLRKGAAEEDIGTRQSGDSFDSTLSSRRRGRSVLEQIFKWTAAVGMTEEGAWTDLICSMYKTPTPHGPYIPGHACRPLYGIHQSRRGHPYGQGCMDRSDLFHGQDTTTTPDHIYPAILADLYMAYINPEEDIHTEKVPQLAGCMDRSNMLHGQDTTTTPDHIYPAMLADLYMTDINPEEDIHTDKLRQEIAVKRPEWAQRYGKLILIHDNARPHVRKRQPERLPMRSHPPYSPEVDPSDYHLFRSMSHGLGEQRFQNREEAENWIDEWITFLCWHQ